MNSAEKFYDELSNQYHLIAVGWDEAVKTQGKILNKLLGSRPLHILDCSCGIGTQAIGLALEGHNVLASDLSSKAVERAKIEAISWDWGQDGKSYDLELFLLKESQSKWVTESFKTTYRAWRREEISSLLASSGFKNIEWLFPDTTGYYQPIVRATREN